MRVMKFRAKDLDNNWIYFQLIKRGLWDIPDAIINLNTLTEYTGLLDSKGNEIYEGDVVKEDDYIGEVFFHNGSYWYNREETWPLQDMKQENSFGGKIIGNVYENPELVEIE